MTKILKNYCIFTLTAFLVATLFATQAFSQNLPPVLNMAKQADWESLQSLLADGMNPNVIYGDGTSALHWASYHDSVDGARLLLTANADVNATTDLGVTPLWLAAENSSVAMADLLLQAGADPGITLLSGETVVMTAAQSGNGDVVRALLAAGADPNAAVTREQTALMWAAARGHSEAVAELLEYGADVHARSLVREQYVKSEKIQDSHPDYKYWIEQGGNTALIFAARSGDLRSAQLLVAAGSDVNGLSAFGTSPAIMAVHGGNAELLDFLLDSGADPDSAASGHTALHAAVLRGNLDAVNVLLAHSANVEAFLERPTPVRRQATDYNFHDSLLGATPLWLAARFSEPKIMQALLQAGANPQVINHVSFPAQRRFAELYIADEGEIDLLMAAVGMGHSRLRVSWGTPERRAGQLQGRQELILDSVMVAVQAGADLDSENAEGLTALAFAKTRRYESVVAFLEAAGAR